MSTHVLTTRGLTHVLLHILGQLYAVFHILVLYKLKHYVAFGRVWVISLIGLLIVLLEEYYRVLAFSHLQVLQHTVLLTGTFAGTQSVGLESTCHSTLGQSIDVDRDKQVSFVLISNLGTTEQLNKLICLAGIDHLHVRTIFLNQSAKGQSKLKREVLLLRDSTHSTSIVATMTSIDNQCKISLSCRSSHHSHPQQHYTYYIS